MHKHQRIIQKNECDAWPAVAMLLVFSLTVSVTSQTRGRASDPQIRGIEFESVTVNEDGKMTNR